ncbi:MAG TPA: hypothetical protein VNS58_20065 [Puia sp.]|nr:hypothetical protein [Puia sp.]
MYLLSVNLYEFGQFLQILLWISLPMVLIVLLITTWLHYRKKRRQDMEEPDASYLFPARNFSEGPSGLSENPSHSSEDSSRPSGDRFASGLFIGGQTASLPEESGNAYRGLLWMKDKYEQYREQTDRKLEKLKEELARSEEKYLNLLISRSPLPLSIVSQPPPVTGEIAVVQDIPSQESSPAEAPQGNLAQTEAPISIQPDEKDQQIGLLQLELEERIKNYHELKELLSREKDKTADLTAKLECNIRLLRRIHQEMDRSLNPEESGQSQSTPLPEVSKIVGWV